MRDRSPGGLKFAASSHNRRAVLSGAGKAATLGVLAAGLGGAVAGAARAGVYIPDGMACMTILYPNGADARFDFDYYLNNHLKSVKDAYGDSLKRIETRRPVDGGDGEPPYLAATDFWVADMTAFQAAAKKHRPALMKDTKNFTNIQATVQQGEVLETYGLPAFQVGEGDRCLTAVYPKDAGSRLDLDYYRNFHLAMLYRLFGFEAIKRYEIRVPMADTDSPFYAGTNIYVADYAAFQQARQRHIDQILADIPNFTDITPVTMMTAVEAVDSA